MQNKSWETQESLQERKNVFEEKESLCPLIKDEFTAVKKKKPKTNQLEDS